MKKTIALFALFFTSHFAFADAAQLTYQYSIPYSGGATLTITNHGSVSVPISQLNFTTNASISANPYGSLWGWESSLDGRPNADGINTDYTITEKPVVIIPANGSAVLTYPLDLKKSGGPLTPYNVAMNPTRLSITVNGATTPVELKVNDVCSGVACKDPGNGKRIMGYYPNWAYWRNPKFTAEKLPYDKVNAVFYAFSIFDADGKVSLYDQDSDAVNLPIIANARQRYPYLNASLSFGGWSWASTPPGWQCQVGVSPVGPAACFSRMAANPEASANFVANAVKAMKEVQFNGIDLDWEYPQVADSDNYVALLQKLRAALDEQGKKDNTHYFLTIAVGAGIDKIQRLSQAHWQAIAASVDYIDAMTYDFHGSWDQGSVGSNFMSAMQLDSQNDITSHDPVLSKYNVTDAMNAFVALGIQPKQLLVGIPVYGRMMNIASAGTTTGLYQPITGTPLGEWDNQQSGATGMLDYQCIVDASTCGNNYTLPALTLVDPTQVSLGQYALTPWGYASQLFVTYDDDKSAALKANWVKHNNFGGVMLWDFTGDFPDNHPRSIVRTIQQVFSGQ